MSEKPKKPQSLNFDRETSSFYVEETKQPNFGKTVDNSVENYVDNYFITLWISTQP